MKRIIVLVFLIIISSIFLKSNLNEKIAMNYELLLGKNFRIYNVFTPYWETKADPALQQNSLNVKVKEYGYVEKLSRYNSLWIGYIPSYKLGTHFMGYFALDDDTRDETLDQFKNRMKKFEGYFVINKDIEKIGMSEEELLKYLNIKGIEEIKFKDPNYYVQKYGGEKQLTPYYVKKEMIYRMKTKETKGKTIAQFETERVVRIITCIIFILLGVLGIIYISINKIRRR